jgi:hypothetical protein
MKRNQFLFSSFLFLFLLPIFSRAQIVYNNGPVFNSVGTGSGGANESVLYTTTFSMATIGFGQALPAVQRVADDFLVTSNSQIDSIAFYAYQTGSTTVSTMNHVNFRIWNGPPDSLGSSIVYGDTTTNRLSSTGFSNIYRITETTTGNTQRPIMRNLCATPGLTLSPGTYWIDWQTGGTLASGPWQPPLVPVGVAVTGNGKQKVSGVWNFAVDGGTGNPAQGFPFVLYGPTLTSTPLTFPSVCVGSNNIQSTTITGGGLTGTSVVVGPLASFGFSTNPLGPFDPTVTLSYVGSTLSSVVYVQYLPLAAGNNNGNIPMLGGGASGNIAVTANANSAPTVTASSTPSPATVCAGSSVTLNGAGASTYTWTDGVNTPTDGLAFVPTSSSTYTVTGTDGSGCTATSTIAVNVNASPVVSSTATPSAICLGSSSTLDAVSPSLVLFTESFANNTQGWTLGTEWGIGSATASAGQGYGNADPATDNTPTADNGVAGVVIGGHATTTLHPAYYLTSPVINLAGTSNVTLNFARWLNSDYTPYMQNTIDVYDGSTWVNIWQTGGAPGIQDNAWTPQTFNISAYVNANFQVRFGVAVGNAGAFTVSSWNIDDVEITSSSTMTWSGPATIANPTLASTLVTPVTSGAQTYTVTVTDGNGCTASSTSVVTVNTPPTVTANSLPSPATVCPGNTVTLNGAGATTYTWTDGINTPTDGVAFTPTANSTYTVTGTDGIGCTATSTIAVNVNASPVVSSTATPSAICLGGSSTLDAISPSLVVFTENFANNSQGWTLGTEWGIGSATASAVKAMEMPILLPTIHLLQIME